MSGATKILMGSGGVDLPSDDEFDNVSFLSHFDGSNNGTNIVYDDGSDSNHTLSLTGTPQQGTFGPFARVDGEWSNYFDGTDGYLSAADSSDWDLGSGSYTVEAWVWAGAGVTASTFNNIVGQWPQTGAPSTNSWLMENSSGVVVAYAVISSTATLVAQSATLPLAQWVHVALVRNGNAHNIYINGVAGATTTNTNAYDAGSGAVEVGGFSHSSLSAGNWDGYISNVRVVKGTAVYTSNFTPSTSALTAISGTVLLTCQSNRFKDNSASAHAITVAGTPKVTAFTPILTSEVYDPAVNGASAFFVGGSTRSEISLDGTGSDFAFGTGAFTIEGWYYRNGTGQAYEVIYHMGVLMQVYFTSATELYFYVSSNEVAVVVNATTTLGAVKNEWIHWAISRSGSNLSIFVNGVRALTTASAGGTFGALTNVSYPKIIIGGMYDNTTHYPFGGYSSDVRILKGTAVYDPTASTCTVPTAPLTAVTNTKLLLNMADGQALDSAAQNNMTLTNGAVTSTTQEKFGTASLDLTATDAWVTFPASTNFFGSGNFTIEAWVYVEDVSAYNSIISYGDPIQFYVKSGTLECYAKPLITSGGYTSAFYGPSSSISDDTWCHVAMVRNGTLFTAYVNGVGGTAHDSGSTAALTAYTGTASIGAYNSAAGGAQALSFDGYIDELRVSNFARYTSNFTPTTEAFPDKGQ